MLTDIFANRYAQVTLWRAFDEPERRLLVQAFRIVSEQLFPYYDQNKERIGAVELWEGLNKQLAMELGLKDLSPPTYGYYNPQKYWIGGSWPKVHVCEVFVLQEYNATHEPDRFIKERLSFIEIAFRRREEQVAATVANLPKLIVEAQFRAAGRRVALPGDPADGVRARVAAEQASIKASCDELNTRFRQAGANLDYHNGFIQLSTDETTNTQIERPFWALVMAPKWVNVDRDMKEAIDLRDSGGRDPTWYAAKSLESTIKIISDEKGWSRGNEKGAVNYLDNLRAQKNGEFINSWEHKLLHEFFVSVRNPFGHGAGSKEMPQLTAPQTDWAIGFAMVWIRNLIRRL